MCRFRKYIILLLFSGYFQPAGPLISSSQLKAGPSQVEEMQGTSSQAVTFTTYQPHPTGYLEPPGYPHAYAKYPPPPPHTGYSPHRRYFYPALEPYPSPYTHPHYYSPYTPPPQPPPPFRSAPYMGKNFIWRLILINLLQTLFGYFPVTVVC